jgi:mannose-6-phosphate isomerase-like protein (cupin superfamily)
VPILRNDMTARPDWCELEHFEILAVEPSEELRLQPTHAANKLVVATGSCTIRSPDGERTLLAGESVDLRAGDHAVSTTEPATVVELGGDWGSDCGGVGIFHVETVDDPKEVGDPVWYPKQTNFDRHYHDCDEYWIVVSGGGTAVTEEAPFEVGPGDCVATQMGQHHDFPSVTEPVLGVYFETTMKGQRRRGHLWERVHGPAQRP